MRGLWRRQIALGEGSVLAVAPSGAESRRTGSAAGPRSGGCNGRSTPARLGRVPVSACRVRARTRDAGGNRDRTAHTGPAGETENQARAGGRLRPPPRASGWRKQPRRGTRRSDKVGPEMSPCRQIHTSGPTDDACRRRGARCHRRTGTLQAFRSRCRSLLRSACGTVWPRLAARPMHSHSHRRAGSGKAQDRLRLACRRRRGVWRTDDEAVGRR